MTARLLLVRLIVVAVIFGACGWMCRLSGVPHPGWLFGAIFVGSSGMFSRVRP